jgi:uncharacterized protein involved in type VI secretion and phage assembly
MSVVQGVVTGLITAVKHEGGEGLVKASFRWLDDDHETDWIRVATLMAGPGSGTYFMPRVNDECMLAFEHGDVRAPYVVGFLHNGVDDASADHVRLRRIQSVNGHRISFIDATPSGGSKGALVIEDAHGNTISLSNGKLVIKSVGLLEIEAPAVAIQGPRAGGTPPWRRLITPNNNPI